MCRPRRVARRTVARRVAPINQEVASFSPVCAGAAILRRRLDFTGVWMPVHPVQYLVIAGPQAAGKSSLMRSLCLEESAMIPLEESRQIIVHKNQRKGAIFMTPADEIEVIHYDMMRMFTIIGKVSEGSFYLDETNIFTLGHARAHGVDLLEGYFKQYTDMLARLQGAVLFVDIPSDVSWERRRHRYVQRLWDLRPEEREVVMAKYRAYLERLRPELIEIFDRLDCPKLRIDSSGLPNKVSRLAIDAVRKLQNEVRNVQY